MVSIQTGVVVDGRVVVDDDVTLPEGEVVGILVHDHEQAFDLGPAGEVKIARAVGQIDRGEGLSEEAFWARVRSSR